MKKYLIYLVILFSLFIGINKIKANSYTIDINEFKKFFKSFDSLSSTRQEHINNYIQNNCQNKNYYVGAWGTNIYIYSWNKSDVYDDSLYLNFNYNESADQIAINFYLKNDSDTSIGVHEYAYDFYENKILYDRNRAPYRGTSGANLGVFRFSSNSYETIVYGRFVKSNVNIKYTSFSEGNNIKIEDFYFSDNGNLIKLSNEDILINSNGELNLNNKYTYSNNINCNGINKIEVNFNIPTNESFSFDLNYTDLFYSDNIPKPYLISGNEKSIIDNFIEDKTLNNGLYSYSINYNKIYTPLENLKLIIDVSNYNDDYIIDFESSINFSVNLITTESENQYIETIALNDKYGIYLIPKTLNNDIFNSLFLNGIYDIEVRTGYNNEQASVEYFIKDTFINYSDNYFQYFFGQNKIDYVLFFVNKNYNTRNDDNYYIKIDTRYFTYKIKDNDYTPVEITNPNNNETYYIKPDDQIKNDSDKYSLLDNILNSFNHSDKFSEVFNEQYNKFRNGKIGSYIFLIITTSIVILLIKSIKK